MKNLNRSVHSSEEQAHETCSYPEYVLCLQKERQIRQKSKFNLFFFLWKTRVEASKIITNS